MLAIDTMDYHPFMKTKFFVWGKLRYYRVFQLKVIKNV